jgi:N-acylneuraminate cytidylyltransferase
MDKKDSIAIITARGGSKRIPRKNIKEFLGFPIIKYSIEAALKASFFDEVMVSTEDPEIAEIARSYGAKVPFFRSAATADDHADTVSVLKEVILEYRKLGIDFTYLCGIYPTAPFITAKKLKQAMSKLKDSGAGSVLPVTRFSYPIQRALKIEDGRVKMINPENYFARSQDLMPTYHDCGQFYCMQVEAMFKESKYCMEYTLPYEIPDLEVQDIDNLEDWEIAEIKYQYLLKKGAMQ